AAGVDPAAGVQLADSLDWLPGQGIRYQVGTDAYGMGLLLATALVGLASMLASWGVERRSRLYFSLLLAMQSLLTLAFAAQDLFLFLVSWQLALLLAYFLTGLWGGARRTYAGMKFWLMVGVGQAFTLASAIALYMLNGSNADLTVMLRSHPAAVAPMALQIPLFLCLCAGFVVQAPLFPVHRWQPDTVTEAPLAVTVMVTGLLGTLAVYALMRLGFGIMPGPAQDLAPFFTGLGLVTVLYAAWGAIVQTDLRRTIGYGSMGILGLAVVGLGTFQQAGIKGTCMALLGHALLVPLLLVLGSVLVGRTGSWKLSELSSLTRLLPRLRLAVIVAFTLGLVLPFFAGFPHAALLPGIVASQPAVGVVAVLGWAGLAWSILMTGRSLALGLASPQFKGLSDLTLQEAIPVALLGLAALLLGVFPVVALTAVDAFGQSFFPLIGL
ncbi:MAG TPA: proton-conducting transporter membrane subunit, partial [Stenomitos sp.]